MIEQPAVTITCDGEDCEHTHEVVFNEAPGYWHLSDDEIDRELHKYGWSVLFGVHKCYTCSHKPKSESVVE